MVQVAYVALVPHNNTIWKLTSTLPSGNTQCYDKMEALQTCFASSICKQEAAQYRACLTTTASQQQQLPREAGQEEDVCSPERLRVNICVQDHFFADMANNMGIPLDHFANK